MYRPRRGVYLLPIYPVFASRLYERGWARCCHGGWYDGVIKRAVHSKNNTMYSNRRCAIKPKWALLPDIGILSPRPYASKQLFSGNCDCGEEWRDQGDDCTTASDMIQYSTTETEATKACNTQMSDPFISHVHSRYTWCLFVLRGPRWRWTAGGNWLRIHVKYEMDVILFSSSTKPTSWKEGTHLPPHVCWCLLHSLPIEFSTALADRTSTTCS